MASSTSGVIRTQIPIGIVPGIDLAVRKERDAGCKIDRVFVQVVISPFKQVSNGHDNFYRITMERELTNITAYTDIKEYLRLWFINSLNMFPQLAVIHEEEKADLLHPEAKEAEKEKIKTLAEQRLFASLSECSLVGIEHTTTIDSSREL